MTGKQVSMVRTSFSMDDLVPTFVEAWKKLTSSTPTKEQIAMVMSQNALETGGFTTKAMFNYNIGNIIKTPNDDYDYFEHPDSYHGKKFMSKFRAYNTLADGVYDYLRLLKNGYPQAFQATTATPTDFAHALVANPKFQYYDATHEKDYASGMNRLYNDLLKSDKFNSLFGEMASSRPPEAETQDTSIISQISNLLNKFLALLAESNEIIIKRADSKLLPEHTFIIKVDAKAIIDAIEFSRILCLALDEKLMATGTIYTNWQNTEIECKINGNKELCEESIIQLCDALINTFKENTKKIGSIKINTQVIPNMCSNYQQLSIKLAELNYTMFHNRFRTTNGK